MNKKEIQMYFGCQVYEAYLSAGLFSSGMGYAVLARKTAGGAVVSVNFLCDHFCLGIKDCFPSLQSEAVYRETLRNTSQASELAAVAPGYLKKYVIDLVAWAKSIGFDPHPDYKFCREILQGIVPDPEAIFQFGLDGVPTFMNGPHDTPQRVQQVVATLEAYKARTGLEANFTMLLGSGGSLADMMLPGE